MLENIHSSADVRTVPEQDLPVLADELRRKIISTVAGNGGHLASNCGTVELTVALHHTFELPEEKIFFDVGHQAYSHKLLSGRGDGFARLRKIDGVAGFPNPAESPCDPAPAGHAGTALSLALGAAAAEPDSERKVIAVVGDGCIGCGVTFEALNNVSTCPGKKRLILIINDNQMSISRNVGAISRYLGKVIAAGAYNRIRYRFKRRLLSLPRIFSAIRRMVYGMKRLLLPQGHFFEAFGLRYIGPVDGHDIRKLVQIFRELRKSGGPVVLHVATRKGAGCAFAEADPTRYHGIPGCDSETGEISPSVPGFSKAFGNAMLELAGKDPRVTAVSAAMIEGTGLKEFADKLPQQIFDVGIAEEHALTFAASLGANGKLPVCAIYDTFLQRALDGVYHDGVLAQVPLVIAVDRAGVVEDGPTHHGIYNCGFLRAIPGITIMAPARCEDVKTYLFWALKQSAPVVIRYPRGSVTITEYPETVTLESGKAAVIRQSNAADQIVIWSIGAELATALKTADILKQANIETTVVDARFLKPFDRELAVKFSKYHQFTIENHSIAGGLYSALVECCSGISHLPITGFGWPDDEIIPHGSAAELRQKYGLTSEALAKRICAVIGKSF